MALHIITGEFKGRKIHTPPEVKGSSKVRPTKGLARAAAFNMLSSRLDWEGQVVLDLFCGSGALGLEALSRGAVHATFVDTDLQWVRKTAVSFGLTGERAAFVSGDALRMTPARKATLVLADPPYGQGYADKLLKRRAEISTPESLWLVETEREVDLTLAAEAAGFTVEKRAIYGKSVLWVLV